MSAATTINLNDNVRAKLTPLGIELARTGGYEHCLRDGDVFESCLWEFAQAFGSHLGNGFPNVVIHTDLEIQSH